MVYHAMPLRIVEAALRLMKNRKQMVSAFKYMLLSVLAFGGAAFAQTALPPDVLVRQSGQQVTLQDVDTFALTVPVKDRAGFFDSPKRIEQVLQNLLTRKLVVQEARSRGMGVDPVANAGAGQLDDDALYRLRMEQVRDASRMPDLTLLAHEAYLADPSSFRQSGRIDVKFIAVKVPRETIRSAPTDAQMREARKAIAQLAAAVGGDPAQFDVVATDLQTRAPGVETLSGEITHAVSDRYPDALREAARKLKEPGEVSAPVETVDAMYVLKLVSREPDRQLSFDEVKESIIERKRADYLRREVDEYLGGLRTTPLEVNPEAIAGLRDRYRLEPAGDGATPG